MLTCKQVSKALLESDYQKLPRWRQKLMKFHIRCCVMCGKYNQQVVDFQDGMRTLREHEDEVLEHVPGLDEAGKARIRSKLDTPPSA